jgi:hypothetical protein
VGAAIAMAVGACGRSDAPDKTATPSVSTTSAPGTPTTTTVGGASTSTPVTTATVPGTATPLPTTDPPTSELGPEWVQRDGRVLIEAVASDDPQQLLADLVALGLTDGVVAGRLVNGWLPVESFAAAQRLATLQFVQPTGAGTG